jgi:hypothetical protein
MKVKMVGKTGLAPLILKRGGHQETQARSGLFVIPALRRSSQLDDSSPE